MLRWKLTYSDGREVCSPWNQSDPENPAHKLSKSGLLLASIERKQGCIVKPVVMVDNEDFCMFQWGKVAFYGKHGVRHTHNTELVLLARNHNYVVKMDGTVNIEEADNANNTSLHFGRE
jgi:hypothetical protein